MNVLHYQWPREPVTLSFEPDQNTATYQKMDMNEVREALRQNGYTIVKSSRIISCWGESPEPDYLENCKAYGADYTQAVTQRAAHVAARQAAKYAGIVLAEPDSRLPPYGKIIRAELVVINQEKA